MTPTAPYVLPGPSLLHGLHWLLAFAELDAVVSEARTRIGGQG